MVNLLSENRAKRCLNSFGIVVPSIVSTVRNQMPFAQPCEIEKKRLGLGLEYISKPCMLSDGSFTNSFQINWDLKVNLYNIDVHAHRKLNYLIGNFDDSSCSAGINGGFCFVSDDYLYQPLELALDLCIRAGKVISLPSITKPALIVTARGLDARSLEAIGQLKINDIVFEWSGSKEDRKDKRHLIKIYGVSNCEVKYKSINGLMKRYVEKELNLTPKNAKYIDVVLSADDTNNLYIRKINKGGGTDLFSGNVILQILKSDYQRIGTIRKVEIIKIDNYDVNEISSAISVGPDIRDAALYKKEIRKSYDKSLGKFPFGDVRHARAIIYKTRSTLSIRVFDAAPLAKNFCGLTPNEVMQILKSELVEMEWGYHLDGGQTAKLVFRDSTKIQVKGNLHYLIWPKNKNDRFIWNGINGRLIPSSIIIRSRTFEI